MAKCQYIAGSIILLEEGTITCSHTIIDYALTGNFILSYYSSKRGISNVMAVNLVLADTMDLYGVWLVNTFKDLGSLKRG